MSRAKADEIQGNLYPGRITGSSSRSCLSYEPPAVTSSIIRQFLHIPSDGSPHRSQEGTTSGLCTYAAQVFFKAHECISCCRVTGCKFIQHIPYIPFKRFVLIRTPRSIIVHSRERCIEFHLFFGNRYKGADPGNFSCCWFARYG